MDEHWEIVQYIKAVNEGQCNPFIGLCANGNEEAEFVIKAKGIGRNKVDLVTDLKLYNEYLGINVARAIGIAAPEPAIIHINRNMARTVNSVYRSGRISEGFAVGSRLFSGIMPWNESSFMRSDYSEEAFRILACDVLIHNTDRKRKNPNCGFMKGGIIAYDYEMSFFGFYNPEINPVEIGALIRKDHIFANIRNVITQSIFNNVRNDIQGINKDFTNELNNHIPPIWECDPVNLADWLLRRINETTSSGSRFLELLK